MTRLIVVVEGQTEEEFVRRVLGPHLDPCGVFTSATIVGREVARRRGHRQHGGGHFRHWRRDIVRILAGDPSEDLRVSTLFDLYGLPRDFPGLAAHRTEGDTTRRCDLLEAALAGEFDDHRLIPYLQRHEFEALVLASIESLAELLDAQEDLDGLPALKQEIANMEPEDVNDDPDTAPSRRLRRRVPSYRKVLHGPLAVEGTGLHAIRERCPRFDAWVRTLEGLTTARGSPG